MRTAKNILHPLMRLWIRCTTYFFFEKIIITGQENIPEEGPVILASNHPDSFLDALLLTAFYKRPIYYLARGDVFSTRFITSILGFLNIVPIFRKEEGAENLSKNDATFTFCADTFRSNGTILIFSEGGSSNKWELRPLRKGTARLAYNAWLTEQMEKQLKVLPVAINYSSWLSMNNKVYLSFLPAIEKRELPNEPEQGIWLRKFNELLKSRLEKQCIIIDNTIQEQKLLAAFLLKNFKTGKEMAIKATNIIESNSPSKQVVLALAGYIKTENISYYRKANILNFIIGIILFDLAFILNVIPYSICKKISAKTTKYDEFFDSVLFCVILFVYPGYLILLFSTIYLVSHLIWAGLLGLSITLLLGKLSEWSKGNIQSFIKRKHYAKLTTMIHEAFGTSNG